MASGSVRSAPIRDTNAAPMTTAIRVLGDRPRRLPVLDAKADQHRRRVRCRSRPRWRSTAATSRWSAPVMPFRDTR